MNSRLLLWVALVLSGPLFAAELATNAPPQAPTKIWRFINYPWPGAPQFLITSGEQSKQIPLGLRVDIMGIQQGFGFFKTNAIMARLYRADGEIVEPTAAGRKLLNAPISTSWAARLPDGAFAPQVVTFFPWGTNALEEAWIEVTIGPERYWLEIPYGFDRNPTDPLPSAVPGGPPEFAPAMRSLTDHDHIVRWKNVEYVLAQKNHEELSLKQANPFDAESALVLYSDASAWRLDSPKTAVRIRDADGVVRKGVCVNLHLNDNHWRRTDTFQFGRYGDDSRCWGQVEVSVGDKTYHVAVPSSLYKYVHGHADKPAAIAYLAELHVGMTLAEADGCSRNYIASGIRHYPVSFKAGHKYQYTFPHHGGEITLRFDSSDRLVSWKGGNR